MGDTAPFALWGMPQWWGLAEGAITGSVLTEKELNPL